MFYRYLVVQLSNWKSFLDCRRSMCLIVFFGRLSFIYASNKVCFSFLIFQRLYRQLYHKQKDKIHTTPDTPEIRQVKATQDAISDVGFDNILC